MQITLDNSIETVLFNNVSVDKIIFNGTTVWEKMSMFNFTGIDANGNYETQLAFNGTVIEYAVGKFYYNYYRYDQVTPTPTEASDYNNKYVYNENTSEYVIYSSSLSWVVIGTTPCYTQSIEKFYQEFDTTGTNYRRSSSDILSDVNNGLNSNYFNNYDFTNYYFDENQIPNLNIETIIIPNTYNGKPVTKIAPNAFHGFDRKVIGTSEYDDAYYATHQIKNFTLGQNIKELDVFGICYINVNSSDRSFNFNNNIQKITQLGIYNYPQRNTNSIIRLPSSVIYIDNAFASTKHLDGGNSNHVYKLIISSANITCGTPNTWLSNTRNGVADYVDYVVFERTVQNIDGILQCSAADSEHYKNIVFKHLQNDQITINVAENKSAVACTIYTDCDAVKNYDWASQNYTVTFKPLSEYEGD